MTQSSNLVLELIDVDAIETDLNTEFKKNATQQELSMRHMRDQERNTYRNHMNCSHRLTGKM